MFFHPIIKQKVLFCNRNIKSFDLFVKTGMSNSLANCFRMAAAPQLCTPSSKDKGKYTISALRNTVCGYSMCGFWTCMLYLEDMCSDFVINSFKRLLKCPFGSLLQNVQHVPEGV